MSANPKLRSKPGFGVALAAAALAAVLGCGAREEAARPKATTAGQASPAPAELPEPTPLPAGIAPLIEPFSGDLDGMLERRVIRVLTVQNPILYFVDQGLDPNKWFNNVELIAAKRIGRETVTYVANIYKYYLAYQMMMQQTGARERAKTGAGTAPAPLDGG